MTFLYQQISVQAIRWRMPLSFKLNKNPLNVILPHLLPSIPVFWFEVVPWRHQSRVISSLHRTEMSTFFVVFVAWVMLLMGLSLGKATSHNTYNTFDASKHDGKDNLTWISFYWKIIWRSCFQCKACSRKHIVFWNNMLNSEWALDWL